MGARMDPFSRARRLPGAASKLDPARFRAADIFETGADPPARVVRRELRGRPGLRALGDWLIPAGEFIREIAGVNECGR